MKRSGLKFREFLATKGIPFSLSEFLEKRTTSRGIHKNCENLLPVLFASFNFQKFLVEGCFSEIQ